MGAAMATVFAYLIMVGSIYFATQKIYAVNYEYKKIVAIFIYLLISLGVYYIFDINLILRLIIIIFMPVIFYMSKFFDKNEKEYIYRLLKKIKQD